MALFIVSVTSWFSLATSQVCKCDTFKTGKGVSPLLQSVSLLIFFERILDGRKMLGDRFFVWSLSLQIMSVKYCS